MNWKEFGRNDSEVIEAVSQYLHGVTEENTKKICQING
jgi:hypothetical protein